MSGYDKIMHNRVLEWLDRPAAKTPPYRARPMEFVKLLVVIALACVAVLVVNGMIDAMGVVPFLLWCLLLQGLGSRN